MANNKAVPDELIISNLLSGNTIRTTAEELEISERTIYNRMKDEHFKLLYKGAKADLLRTTVSELQDYAVYAAVTIIQIMNDPETNPAIRLQAANSVLNQSAKMTQCLDVLETSLIRQAEDNEFISSGGTVDDLPWH